ncbi:MAG: response regulator, partial [Candidatus Binataceae bacterium]
APGATTLRFTVRDTGIGISSDAQRRLFQPFSQAETSTARNYGGSGLGLAICTRLVELMSGAIGVQSTPGDGSTFWFTVPLRSAGSASTLADEAAADLAGLRVLIADDANLVASALCQQLVSWRLDCDLTTSAAETLEALRAAAATGRPFDVVLIGTEIDGGGALALPTTIGAEPGLGRPRLIAAYRLGQRPAERRMRDAGIRSWIAKPIRPSVLLNRLTEAIAQPETAVQPETTAGPEITNLRAPAPLRPGVKTLSAELRNSARILLAEDHVINQRVTMSMLEKLGFRADAVANGRAVISALNARPYDLVLMDCQMPDLDGYEATRQIRETAVAYRDIPIIGVTAHALEGDREKCLAAGTDDYLTKPILPEKLAETVELWLTARAAANGREALDALERSPHDLILMDCQMPEMDGYEATREMRRRYAPPKHIPIIGVTAHSFQGDRPKCLDARIDDYPSKPFLPEQLAEKIATGIARHSIAAPLTRVAADQAPGLAPAITPCALDRLRSAAADDAPNFLLDLIDTCLADMAERVTGMRRDLANGDPISVSRVAHALRGSSAHFGAVPLMTLCARIEQLVSAGSIEPVSKTLARLEAEAVRVRTELEAQRAIEASS